MGDFLPAFRGTEEGLSVLGPARPAVFQVTSIQKNQYAIVAPLGTVCSGSLSMIHFRAAQLFCVQEGSLDGGQIMRLCFLSISAPSCVLGMAPWQSLSLSGAFQILKQLRSGQKC